MTTREINHERDRFEVYNTIMLAIATLAVAWCSYQGSLWGGIQIFRLAEASKLSRLSQLKLVQSGQNMAMEELVVIDFVNAAFVNDKRKINYLAKALRPEMAGILLTWLNSNPFQNDTAAKHPMIMPEYRALMKTRLEESDKARAHGEEMFSRAQEANNESDKYNFLTVMFSTVMFLGAITTKLNRNNPRIILGVISALLCLAGLILICFYMPIAQRG